jgi:hypothetical protein
MTSNTSTDAITGRRFIFLGRLILQTPLSDAAPIAYNG